MSEIQWQADPQAEQEAMARYCMALDLINAAIEAGQAGDPIDVNAMARDFIEPDLLVSVAERHAVCGVLDRTATKYVYRIPGHD